MGNCVGSGLASNPDRLPPVNDDPIPLGHNVVHLRRLSPDVRVQTNVAIPTRDGTLLRANIYSPRYEGRYPVLMHFTPYGKDHVPTILPSGAIKIPNIQYFAMSTFLGGDFGNVSFSNKTPWEAADPDYWCQNDFVVIHADTRGFAKSGGAGQGAVLGAGHEPEDYYDLIEWAASQPWSNGKVGLIGVSYLAISQWHVAALRPPSLCAICPWEGISNPYRDLVFVGGTNPTNFFDFWLKAEINPVIKGRLIEDYPARKRETEDNNNLCNDFWRTMAAKLEDIEVPALVCGSWSDQGIHNPASFENFERLGSAKKWLYTHGRSKWDVFYRESDLQRRFFDCYLKGEQNGWEQSPRVRVEVRDTKYKHHVVRYEDAWPLLTTKYTPLYLSTGGLRTNPAEVLEAKFQNEDENENELAYDPLVGEATFKFTFQEETELTGYFMLRVWVSCEGHDDMDIFVATHKLNASGRRQLFCGVFGDITEGVSKGFLRVSHRVSYNPEKSRPYRPYYEHDASVPLPAGEYVRVDIPMNPSSTIFHAGESIELTVAGRNLVNFFPMVRPKQSNRGTHKLKFGGAYDSHLLVPVIPPPVLA